MGRALAIPIVFRFNRIRRARLNRTEMGFAIAREDGRKRPYAALPILRPRLPLPSHHSVLRIIDPPVEIAGAALAVERHGEVAERVGGVRAPIVHRVWA